MLSSDILEKQFGPTEIRILKQTDTCRVIQTIVKQTNDVVELSFVTFDEIGMYPGIHQNVVNGGSMGAAFRDADVPFVRDMRSVSVIDLPDSFKPYISPIEKATVVHVAIYVGPEKTHYCDIVEIYNSAVDWPQPITAQQTNLTDVLTKSLALLRHR